MFSTPLYEKYFFSFLLVHSCFFKKFVLSDFPPKYEKFFVEKRDSLIAAIYERELLPSMG